MRRFLSYLFVVLVAVMCITSPWWATMVDAEPRYPGAEVVEKAAFLNITTATTTTVKAGAGSLAGIVVNGGTMGAITVYDSLTATSTKIATVASPIAGMVLPYGARFGTGLTIVTGAATDITVLYY